MKIAVIGGGWAGLAAAVELASAGVKVSIFEAARQLGGRARSVSAHGHTLDNGQHILVGAYRETLRLMNAVGADPERRLKRTPLELSFPGSQPPFHLRLPRLPAPLHLALGLLGARGCSLAEKIGAVRFMRFLQASDYRLDADSTVAALLDRHAQHGSLRRHLWEPLCLAALNTEAQSASAQIFANVLRDSLGGGRSETDLLLPATDLDQLFPIPAADFIRTHGGKIHLSSRIERIDDGLKIAGEAFDRIILASAPQHAAGLLAQRRETAAVAALLEGYAYEPIGTVYAGYPPQIGLPCPMLGLDGGNEGKLGQWVFDRGALGGVAGVMAFVLSARGAWDERDNEALAAALHAELEDALQKKLAQPLWHRVIRERRATFSCRPDLPRPAAQTSYPGLWLAGDYVCADYPATLEG
ncbi:MAG: hydroxysqualene dehydroxylase HpnE, partial [Rhodocyclaceae bacterium]